MRYRKKYFFVTALLLVVLFFCLPRNYDWFFGGILNPPVSYGEQLKYLAPDDRRMLRYGQSYEFYMKLASVFSRVHKDSVVLLLPPGEYLKRLGINFMVVEPAEFYYYTGYRAVWANSPDADRANCVVVPHEKWVTIKGIRSEEEAQQLLKLYRPYLP